MRCGLRGPMTALLDAWTKRGGGLGLSDAHQCCRCVDVDPSRESGIAIDRGAMIAARWMIAAGATSETRRCTWSGSVRSVHRTSTRPDSVCRLLDVPRCFEVGDDDAAVVGRQLSYRRRSPPGRSRP